MIAVEARGIRVALVGAGPAGFYTAAELLKHENVEVHLFEKLPAPYGLVRYGVAPDHPSIKKITSLFHRIAAHERSRFWGHVNVGSDLTLEQLHEYFDAIVLATGASQSRRLKIPGEDLEGCYPGARFVYWYNGHPDYRTEKIGLSARKAVVVGMGNVALDISRVLLRRPEELALTDIATYALKKLRDSPLDEVVLLGRRGPAQGAFDLKELQTLCELDGVNVEVRGLGEFPANGEQTSGGGGDRVAEKKLAYVQELCAQQRSDHGQGRKLVLQFFASPVAILGNGRVEQLQVESTHLVQNDAGAWVARGRGEFQTLDVQMVIPSVGYQSESVPGAPFDRHRALIANTEGRVMNEAGKRIAGLYVSGWVKRGPTGLIGSNKGDGKETALALLEDLEGVELADLPEPEKLADRLRNQGVRVVDIGDWNYLDMKEREEGARMGKAREKFYSAESMLEALQARS